MEDARVSLRPGVVELLKLLDERGILQSIASKNEYDIAMAKLREFGLDHYFIYPQISWNPKSDSIGEIAARINIGINSIAFIDDQAFEREEVHFAHPEVLLIDASQLDEIADMPRMNSEFITSESKLRRKFYQNDIIRNQVEQEFKGTPDDFLRSLDMKFTISPVRKDDLKRVEELTVRTHQLNATGRTYSYNELTELQNSSGHKLLIADLTDKYGEYGKIGLALIECNQDEWILRLLLMSCRVISRGVGSILLNHILNLARDNGKPLLADFVPTDRNRIMYVTYKFAGFREIGKEEGVVKLRYDASFVQPLPDYVQLCVEDS